MDTPADLSKSGDCVITVTEAQNPKGCQYGSCTAGSKPLVSTGIHQGNNLFGTDVTYFCQQGQCIPPCQGNALCVSPAPVACDAGFHQGQCSATRTSVDNGSLCIARWADSTSCSCLVEITTPADLSKSVDCAVTVTETQNCP
jgi:hypothetical protein